MTSRKIYSEIRMEWDGEKYVTVSEKSELYDGPMSLCYDGGDDDDGSIGDGGGVGTGGSPDGSAFGDVEDSEHAGNMNTTGGFGPGGDSSGMGPRGMFSGINMDEYEDFIENPTLTASRYTSNLFGFALSVVVPGFSLLGLDFELPGKTVNAIQTGLFGVASTVSPEQARAMASPGQQAPDTVGGDNSTFTPSQMPQYIPRQQQQQQQSIFPGMNKGVFGNRGMFPGANRGIFG